MSCTRAQTPSLSTLSRPAPTLRMPVRPRPDPPRTPRGAVTTTARLPPRVGKPSAWIAASEFVRRRRAGGSRRQQASAVWGDNSACFSAGPRFQVGPPEDADVLTSVNQKEIAPTILACIRRNRRNNPRNFGELRTAKVSSLIYCVAPPLASTGPFLRFRSWRPPPSSCWKTHPGE